MVGIVCDVVSMVWCGVNGMVWCQWYGVVSMVWCGVNGMVWCQWYGMVSVVWYGVNGMVWCQWYGMVSVVCYGIVSFGVVWHNVTVPQGITKYRPPIPRVIFTDTLCKFRIGSSGICDRESEREVESCGETRQH